MGRNDVVGVDTQVLIEGTRMRVIPEQAKRTKPSRAEDDSVREAARMGFLPCHAIGSGAGERFPDAAERLIAVEEVLSHERNDPRQSLRRFRPARTNQPIPTRARVPGSGTVCVN